MHIETVHTILEQINNQVPEVLVFNKIDKIDRASINLLQEKFKDAIFVSAIEEKNIDLLIKAITNKIFGELLEVVIEVEPINLEKIHKFATIIDVKNSEGLLIVTISIRNYYLEKLISKDIVKLL
jgi:50S ribosomal subunit-associated GTPase HflX